MTSASAESSDSILSLVASDGTTILETDDNDGSFHLRSSSIAGALIPTSGTYYLRVKEFEFSQIPYDLWVSIRSGSPSPEAEPNNFTSSPEVLPAPGWVSGIINPATDQDFFSISLGAGDTVFVSLDLDPERDNVDLPGRVGFATPSGQSFSINDLGSTGPDSEAFFVTLENAGTERAVFGQDRKSPLVQGKLS